MELSVRQGLIVKEYLEGRRTSEICREYGIGERQFYNIIGAAKLPEGQRPKSSADKRPLSAAHLRIGKALYDYYFSRSFDRRGAANKLGWSSLRLRNVELGLVDLTLFELQEISAFTNIPIQELING